MSAVYQSLEPAAIAAVEGSLETMGAEAAAALANLSTAISLKRIADTIDGTAAGLCVTENLLGGRRND